jgi:hypothetical protein
MPSRHSVSSRRGNAVSASRHFQAQRCLKVPSMSRTGHAMNLRFPNRMLNQVTTDEHLLYKRSSYYRHDFDAAARGLQHGLEA